MTNLRKIGLAAATATGMILAAPMAPASAQTFDHSALHQAQFSHRDRDRGFHRGHDRSRFGFGIYVGPGYDYDYCSSHWRWDPYWGRWVLVRDCD